MNRRRILTSPPTARTRAAVVLAKTFLAVVSEKRPGASIDAGDWTSAFRRFLVTVGSIEGTLAPDRNLLTYLQLATNRTWKSCRPGRPPGVKRPRRMMGLSLNFDALSHFISRARELPKSAPPAVAPAPEPMAVLSPIPTSDPIAAVLAALAGLPSRASP